MSSIGINVWDKAFIYLLIVYLACIVGVIYGLITDAMIIKYFIIAGLITVGLAVIVVIIGMNRDD